MLRYGLLILTVLLFGLMPVLQGSSPDLHTTLKEGARAASPGAKRTRIRRTLVVGQVAMTLALLAAAGLLIKSFARLATVDPGVRTANVLTFHVTDTDPGLAANLANAYAASYIAYRRKLDAATLAKASAEVQKQVSQLRSAGQTGTQAYGNLLQQLEQLRTAQTLTHSNAVILRTAKGAGQVAPRPKRFGLIDAAFHQPARAGGAPPLQTAKWQPQPGARGGVE